VSLNLDDIHKLAHLARLEIESAEADGIADKLSGIVAFVDQLKAAATANVSPMAHPLDATQRLRADRVTEQDHHDEFQAVAPLVDRDLYLVPKVIE
jgi:aspartyl-tRNA(Asn)/glutamyl-tRNA(Gln) amidotransferase subunit C